jgi:hypothetical protein
MLLIALKVGPKRLKKDRNALVCQPTSTNSLVTKTYLCFRGCIRIQPSDLIPDFIPIVGFLDDMILLPTLIWIAVRLIPEKAIADSNLKSAEWWFNHEAKPKSKLGLVFVLVIWVFCAFGLYLYIPNLGHLR